MPFLKWKIKHLKASADCASRASRACALELVIKDQIEDWKKDSGQSNKWQYYDFKKGAGGRMRAYIEVSFSTNNF